MLVSATLLATSPVYTRVMNDLGLQSSLKARLGIAGINTAIETGQPFGTPETAASSKTLTDMVSQEIGWFTASEVRYGSLALQTFSLPGEEPSTDPLKPLVQLETVSSYDDHVVVTDGRMAQPTDDPNNIEVLIPAKGATIFHLKVGDHFVASTDYNNCVPPPAPASPDEARSNAQFRCIPNEKLRMQGTFTVVGLIEQNDPGSAYWGANRVLFTTPQETDTQGAILQVLMPEQSFYDALPSVYPRMPSLFQISSLADLTKLDSAQLSATQASIAQLRQRLTDRGALMTSPMSDALSSFKQRSSFNQVTLLLLLLQVVGIAVYYVLLVSSLLLERRAEEIAMLRSRGASVLQVVALSAAEAGLLAVGVALIAPFLASAVVAALGLTSTFSGISDGTFLPFTLVPSSFLYGLAGALIAALAVIIPSFFTARTGMVLFLRGNARPGASLLQRYYLDIILVGLAALALWQVDQRGSVYDASSVGGWSADPLLLLSPLLLILAVGALLFRFLPPLLGLVGRIVARAGGPALTLGFWQMNRSPARYTQLALLVIMAAAVGTFAATYGDTTQRSQQEQVLFSNGVDVRVTNLGQLQNYGPQRVEEALGAIDGVQEVSTADRTSFRMGPLATGGRGVDVLGIDPDKAADQLWFRSDFSSQDFDSLLRRLRIPPGSERGLDLGDARGVALWVDPSVERPTTTMWLRLIDADGSYKLLELGKLDFTGYRRLQADFGIDLASPVRLLGVIMTEPANVQDLTRGQLTIDDITTIGASGNETTVEDFEGSSRWDVLRTPTQTRDRIEQGSLDAHGGSGALTYYFDSGTALAERGVFVSDASIPLPAIASTAFLKSTGLRVGSVAELVVGYTLMPVSIQGQVDYFPTMDELHSQFLIINQQQYYDFSGLINQNAGADPNEAWLTLTKDPAQRADALSIMQSKWAIGSLNRVDTQALLAQANSDPIVRAGGSGVLLIALVAAFAVLALGFGLTLYLGGQARSLEISVLRAMGLSSRQVFVMICMEYLLVAVIGLVIGTLAGLRISRTMLDFLNVTADGHRLLPPFALTTQWDTVAIAFAATGLAFLVGIVALAVYFLRLPLGRMLRITR